MVRAPMRPRNRIWPLAAAAALSILALPACSKKAPPPKYESAAEADYARGLSELEDRSFPQAQVILERVRTKYPYSKYGALAELRLADLKFMQEKYVEAADAYQTFVKIHPSSPEVDYAAFRVALSRYNDAPSEFFLFPAVYERELTQMAKAADGLAQFIEKYPTSKYVPEAKAKLAQARGVLAEYDWYGFEFYKKRERWQGAAFRLEHLLKEYPASPREPEALWQLADCYVRLSERYRAQKALQQLIVKYPDSKLRPGAEKLLAQLRSQPEPAPAPAK